MKPSKKLQRVLELLAEVIASHGDKLDGQPLECAAQSIEQAIDELQDIDA